MSMIRRWVRVSKCSRESLSTWGERRTAVDLAFRGQGDRTDRGCSGVIGCFNDFVAGQIQHAAIKRLQADADLLLSNCSGHRKKENRFRAGALGSVVEVQFKCKGQQAGACCPLKVTEG